MWALALQGALWAPALLYGAWLVVDRKTPCRGGRRSAWVRGWTLWHHFRDYFPISLVRTAELDPRRNYVFGFHPHGVLAAGAFANFCTEATGFGVLFPGLRPHLLTLPCWFRLPLLRDYMLSGGGPRNLGGGGFGVPQGVLVALLGFLFQYWGADGVLGSHKGHLGVPCPNTGGLMGFWGPPNRPWYQFGGPFPKIGGMGGVLGSPKGSW
uniref:Monoacylglycerol O-acyltransferase 3 n=1 Tax=Cairina moschata TaxID=8855 RepID=A0A8C3C911_CAIMO